MCSTKVKSLVISQLSSMKCLIFLLACAMISVTVNAQSAADEAKYGEVSPCVTSPNGNAHYINRLCLATTMLDKTIVSHYYYTSRWWAKVPYYYWSAAYLTPQNFLPDTGSWSDLCSIWNNYFHCITSRAACSFSAAQNSFMQYIHYPRHGGTFHIHFYSRTCSGDTVKPSIQARLSDPSYSTTQIDAALTACWNTHLGSMYSTPGWYKRPDAVAIQCIRKAIDPSWSQATKDIAEHMVDLQRSSSMPQSIVSIDYASADRCTVATYGHMHTLDCGADTLRTCQLYANPNPYTYQWNFYESRFLSVRGFYKSNEIREDLSVGPGNVGLVWYTVSFGSRLSSAVLASYSTGTGTLPSAFTNGLLQVGSGDNMVRLVPSTDMVEMFFDSLGIYVMVRQVPGSQYTVVVREAKSAALDGSTISNCYRVRDRDAVLNGPQPTGVTLAQATSSCQTVPNSPVNVNEVCIYDVFSTGQTGYSAEASQAYTDITGAANSDSLLISLAQTFPILGGWGPAIEVPAPVTPSTLPLPLPDCNLLVPHVNVIYSDCHRMVYHAPVTGLDYMINNLLNSDAWAEHCRKEDEYGNCVLVWTSCTKPDVTQMITDHHPVSVDYGFDPYDDFYTRTCDGIDIEASLQSWLGHSQYDLNDILTSPIPDCLVAYRTAFTPHYNIFGVYAIEPRHILIRITAVAYQCIKGHIVSSGWSNPTKQIARHMADLLTLPDTTPNELQPIQSPYYDFATPRCTMGVYGDPHILRCQDTTLTMCSAPGVQIYFQNMFMVITGTNSLVNFTPLTAMTTLTIQFMSSTQPVVGTWLAEYHAEAGMLPDTFVMPNQFANGLGNSVHMGQDDILLTYISDTHVEILNIYMGVYINIRRAGNYYFFTMRMAETLADAAMGLIGFGCPANQVVTIDDLFTNNKRSTDLEGAKTLCASKNLDEPFYRACVADVYRGRSDMFANMHALGNADADAAADNDADMIAGAGSYDGSCVHRGRGNAGQSSNHRKDCLPW